MGWNLDVRRRKALWEHLSDAGRVSGFRWHEQLHPADEALSIVRITWVCPWTQRLIIRPCAGFDAHSGVYDLFVQLCPVVLPVTLADTDRARHLITDIEGISVRDAIHAAVMLNHDIDEIATFDAGFDAIRGIRRFALS